MGFCHRDVEDILKRIEREGASFERLLDLLHLVYSSARYAKYAHDRFLPAARAYRDYLKLHGRIDPHIAEARRVRARLGGTARALYARQRPTLDRLLEILVPDFPGRNAAMPRLKELAWYRFKLAESAMMRRSRAKASRTDA